MASELLADLVRARLRGPGPHLVGVAGPVAAGKSTVAGELAQALAGVVLGTDAFLLPNAALERRGLLYRKGFPESFDTEGLRATLERIRSGRMPVEVPVYSHAVYDVLPGERASVDAPLIVVEGVNVLQEPVADLLDVGVYVEADEADVRRWYVERFLALTEAARDDPESFYAAFAAMSTAEVEAIARATWDGINAVNLREHIGPSKARADLVVRKGPDHEVRSVR